MSGYRPQRKYTTHTALNPAECFVCGATIEPGEIYMARKIFKNGAYRWTMRKCGQCVTIREVNGT